MDYVLYAALAAPVLTGAGIFAASSGAAAGRINLAGSVLTALLLFTLAWQVVVAGPLHKGHFYVDELSAMLLTVIALLTITAALFSLQYMEREVEEEAKKDDILKRYYVLFTIFTLSMITVPIVENLGLMWVTVEATTLSSALLVAFSFSRAAIEAAWKYVMICTVGLCLALLGTILLYLAQINTGPAAGEALSWLALQQVGDRLDPHMVKIAFVFIVIGYGAKVGLSPMHTWLPDAHSQAPSPVSGLLSGVLLSCALYVIMRNIAIIKGTAAFLFVQQLLIGLGLFSVLMVIPFLLAQHDIKRLLAYSSVEHMGIVTLALGISTPMAVYGALLHIFNHAVVKSALFYMAGIITQEYRTKQMMRIRGLLSSKPRLGSAFLLFVLIITGAPPFGIFFSKLIITYAAFAGGFPLVGTILLLLLGAVFAGMIYYCFQMLFSASAGHAETQRPVGFSATLALTLSVLLITLTGLYVPAFFEAALRQAAALVSGG